jgi:hypothetical protein
MRVRDLAVLVLLALPVASQQPFYTDDADTTERGKFHLEISNQFSRLSDSALPTLRQNALVYQVNYGLWEGVELGIDSPIIILFNERGTHPRRPAGTGDTNLTLKWNFRSETADSRWPALTVSFAVETPTGDASTQLGSGVADYGFNTVVQKSLGDNTTFRLNNGLILSGNTLTGVVGLRAQGVVYTGGASMTRQMSRALLLGLEINGAAAQNSALGKGAMQTQFGGKYLVSRSLTLDFGILVGRLEGSPRASLQVGISKDF